MEIDEAVELDEVVEIAAVDLGRFVEPDEAVEFGDEADVELGVVSEDQRY